MEIKDVIELIKAVSDNGLTGFKIEQGDTKIVLKRSSRRSSRRFRRWLDASRPMEPCPRPSRPFPECR